MTQTTRSIFILAAFLLAACEQGNQAPGALPPMGTFTSQPPAPVPCTDPSGNCATVPEPPVVTPPPTTPPPSDPKQELVQGTNTPPTKPVFKGIPDTMAIKRDSSQSVTKITVSNAGSKPATVTCKFNKATLTQAEDGSYTFTITQSQPADEVDLCTFLAVNSSGEFGTFIVSITSLPRDLSVIPLNFKAETPLIMGNDIKCKLGALNSYYAYVDEACQVFPQFKVENPDGVSTVGPKISCTGNPDKIDVLPQQIPATTFEFYIHYPQMGVAGTTETCKIMINKDIFINGTTTQDPNYPYYEFNFPTLKW